MKAASVFLGDVACRVVNELITEIERINLENDSLSSQIEELGYEAKNQDALDHQ